jgi:predicted alpha/beta superfamily hydrolase
MCKNLAAVWTTGSPVATFDAYPTRIIMLAFFRCCLLALLPAVVHAQAPVQHNITIGTVDSIYSPTLKEYRRYEIYTPPSYGQSPYAPRAYPVMYLLDGDAHFHSVTGLLQILGTGVNGTYVVPEMIVIAIPNTDRTRDLTPTHAPARPDGTPAPALGSSGGMPNFLKFMKTELIPHVDSTLRTAPYRMLIGHSLGGIAAIDALYTMPETFNAYVAIDPSLWWDNQLLYKQANAYFSKPAPASRVLFVGQANTKDLVDSTKSVHYNTIVAFNKLMQTGNKSGVRYGYKYYDGDDHGSVPLIAEYDALHFIFDGYKVNTMAALDRPAAIVEHFAKVSERLGYRVLPPERMVDQLGQAELGRDTTKAVEMMRINTELYPGSSHAFFALGGVYAAKGDAGRAKVAYEKALALDPKNQRAREALGKLGSGNY